MPTILRDVVSGGGRMKLRQSGLSTPVKGKLHPLSCWKAGRLPVAQQEPAGTLHSRKTGPHCLCLCCALREDAFISFVSLANSYTSAPLCFQPSLPHWAPCRSSGHIVRFLSGSYLITGKCCCFLEVLMFTQY